jgi:hypothetical protein
VIRRHALLLLPLFAVACKAPNRWTPVTVDRPFGELWDGFVAIAERQGYIMDRRGSDRGLREFVSHWRESPAPFGMSNRTRLHGRFTRPQADEAGEDVPGWKLEFYVQRQAVTNMKPGFEPKETDWSDSGQDQTREDVLLGQLRLRFGQDLGIDPSFRREG